MNKKTITIKTINVPKEIKQGEKRAGLKPSQQGALELAKSGVMVNIEKSAGKASGFSDKEYADAGAKIVPRHSAWKDADLIVKVKEPLPEEFRYFREGLIVFCFFHLAPNKRLISALVKSGVTAIAYETIQTEDGSTPILRAMSKIAGRVGYIDGKKLLMENKGVLIGPAANIMIVGLGNAGLAAAKEILNPLNPEGLPNTLYAVDINQQKLESFKMLFYPHVDYKKVQCMIYNPRTIENIISGVDLLIGTTHSAGELQKKLVTSQMMRSMKPGSVAVDISIDQGGCFETSRSTSIRKRTFRKYGVTHYCVPNIPGIVQNESTNALTKETFPYLLELTRKGFEEAVRSNLALLRGVNIHRGKVTHEGLAKSIGAKYTPIEEVL